MFFNIQQTEHFINNKFIGSFIFRKNYLLHTANRKHNSIDLRQTTNKNIN